MTNAELIEALRNCSSAEGTCAECSYKSRVYPGTCNGCKWDMMHDAADALEAAEKRIKELEAQLPKEGEWIDIDGTMFAECSVCGKRHYGCTTPYCDMCGARMRGANDE